MGTYKSLFVWTSFFLAAGTTKGHEPLPQNVSLRWLDDFRVELSWKPLPPQTTGNCPYSLIKHSEHGNMKMENVTSPWTVFTEMDGSSLRFELITECDPTTVETLSFGQDFEELTSHRQCEIHSLTRTLCSWTPSTPGQNLSFSYMLVSEYSNSSGNACLSYTYTDGVRTGCNLKGGLDDDFFLSFSKMVDNKRNWNTFRVKPSVRLPPLKWNVSEAEHQFTIKVDPPAVLKSSWKYRVEYTECNEEKSKSSFETTIIISRVTWCPYSFTIMASSERGNVSRSEKIHFDAYSRALLSITIGIPLIFACLALMTFLCCMRYKDSICPEIPQPRDLISDIYENNNTRNFCIPSEKEDSCKIILVMDLENQKLIS